MAQSVVVLTPEQVEDLVQRALAKASDLREQREVMDAEDVGALLGVTKRTVTAYIESEGLPAHQLGPTTLRFRRTEVLAWLTARKAKEGK